MRLLPAAAKEPCDPEDGLWVEQPGWPQYEASWIHPPPDGHFVPEFDFEEGHDHNRNRPPPVLIIGSGNDAQIRQPDGRIPRRLCQVMKLGRSWWLEAVSGVQPVYCGDKELTAGERVLLKHQDVFSLLRPPTPLSYRILLNDDDNWYIDAGYHKEYPNKYRSMMPYRPATCPECPEEINSLAKKTDTMRKRSEDDRVRVADWSAFSQVVKRIYQRNGIECTPWVDARLPHDEKPLPKAPRPYPDWIAEVVAKERPLPGISAERTLPFASCLELSGRQVAEQLDHHCPPPRFGDLSVQSPSVGQAPASSAESATPASAPAAYAGTATTATGIGGRGRGRLWGVGSQRLPWEEAKTLTLKAWLEALDGSGCLCQYHDRIAENFDSLEQIVSIYFKNGEIQKAFFEDAGIKKLGHRRILEKWFSEACAPSSTS